MDRNARIELYENLLKTIADPFFVIGEDGTYLDVLGGAERSLYDDASSLKGRNIHDFMEPDFAKYFMEQVRRAMDGSTLHCFEYQLATETVDGIPKNGPGGTQWFEARLFPVAQRYDGQRAVIALIININERKLMHQRLRELSYQDALTQVANRRFFIERLGEQLDTFFRNKNPLSLMLLDIDWFKHINDTYGHLAGDQILKQLVVVIRGVLNTQDTVARFGGDEFIVSMEKVPLVQALAIAEQLRDRVQQCVFSYGDTNLSVTVSIGVSEATPFDTDMASFISRSDKALYQAKEGGRNKVMYL